MALREPEPALRGALCEARGVTHDFTLPNGQRLRVLEALDLVIRPEEVVALIGPSGCGKSTLLRILAGLVRPASGEVIWHGQPLAGRNPGVAMVFQSFALLPWLTVTRNVEVALEAQGLPADEIQRRVAETVHFVGLTGFENAYPRELSGGMKQRVGMARAMAVNAELLLMDEPFSSVDALTAESLRAELIDLWSVPGRNPSSIVIVSHDTKEVAWIADRIAVLSARPGRVRSVIENPLPRPREYRSPAFLAVVDELHDVIAGHELPEAPPPQPGPAPVEPLPFVAPGEIVGLLEYLDSRGGAEDLFRIAADTNRPFDRVIAVVKAAEMLELVDTPKRQVVLDPLGRRFLAVDAGERKRIWRSQLLSLRLFGELHELLLRARERRLEREAVLDLIVMQMPQEDYERVFDQLVLWGRFGDLLEYDEARQELSLD